MTTSPAAPARLCRAGAPPCDPSTLGDVCAGSCGRRVHRGDHARKCRDGHPAHHGHGQCEACAALCRYHATVAPRRRSWRRDDLLAEWDALRAGCTFRGFPSRVGISFCAWERAYMRARAAGDPRATRGAR